MLLAVEVQRPSHWTNGEFPRLHILEELLFEIKKEVLRFIITKSQSLCRCCWKYAACLWPKRKDGHLWENRPLLCMSATSRTVSWQSFSCVQLSVTPWTIHSMEFSRPEHWSGQPFPSPGDLPDPGIEPRSPALQVGSLPPEPQEKPL